MTLYFGTSKIKDRGATSGLCYAGKIIKNTSFTCRDNIWLSISNKITLDDSGLSDNNECWRISIRFTIPDVTSDQRLFGVVATPCPGVVIGVLNGKLNYWLSSDGVNWDIASRTIGNYTLVAGSTYTVHFKRIKIDGVFSYLSSIRPDGGSWYTDIAINNTTPIKSGFYYNLGRDWGIFSNNITYHLDKDTYITKWNVRGRERRIWSSNIEGVVPVHGIKTAYFGTQRVYNLQSYTPSQSVYEMANPASTVTSDVIPIYMPGVYKIWLIGGGNTTCWCYIGCNGPGSAAGFIGKMYFNTRCYLRIITGGQQAASILQVASWDNPNTWYTLIQCNYGAGASGGTGSGGTISVNRGSTFNNYFDVELESNGYGGKNATWCGGSAADSIWGGYGRFDVNGYSKLEYIRENQ